MQIKVKDTRMHETAYLTANQLPFKVPVTEAKLVLIQNRNWSEGQQGYQPILISETEEIEVGIDWAYSITTKEIGKTVKGLINFQHSNFVKVLALPEHFSPKHLQAIADGKINHGDKVLVECREIYSDVSVMGSNGDDVYISKGMFININSYNNYITLHKVEEKMYTRDEVIQIAMAYREQFRNIVDDKTWFEQNVK